MNQNEFALKSDKIIEGIRNAAEKKKAQLVKQNIIKHYEGDDAVVSFESIYEEEKLKPTIEYISTGFPKLDECLGGGIAPGELIILSGYTGNGKTSFCFDMTRNMKAQNCLWLPFEESAQELAAKSIRFKKDPIHFFTPKFTPRDDLQWIEDRIMESVLKYQTKVVFVDNLHFITMQENQDFNKNGVFAKQIKRMAERYGVAVILIGHLRKSQNGGIHTMPTYEDVQGSSDVVKIANKVIAIWREAKKEHNGSLTYSGYSKVAVQKVRAAFGKLDTITYTWDRGVFEELSAGALAELLKANRKDDF